jgi:hypothetical protein
MGGGDSSGEYSPFADTQDYGVPFDIGAKIISVMRKARAKYPEDEKLNLLVEKIKGRIFPGVRFNDITLEPIRPDTVRVVDGFIPDVKSKRYTLLLQAPVELTVLSVTAKNTGGDSAVTVLINGEPVGGLMEVPVTTAIETTESVGENRVTPGALVELQVVGADGDTDLSYQVEFYFSQSY